MADVSIYTTESCQYCKAAKEYFQENNIDYKEYNVGEDLEKRQEMVEKSGQMGVPVITVGEEVVVGFNQDRLKELLSK